MATLNMVVSHRLTQDEAVRRIKPLLGEVRNQFADKIRISDLREEWDGNTASSVSRRWVSRFPEH